MAINLAFLGELDHEAQTTRKVLERIPTEKFDWKPHEKSMTMGQLAAHVADMFSWYSGTMDMEEMDFAAGYENPKPATTEELLAIFDKNVAQANESLKRAETDEQFRQNWTLRNGEHIFFTLPRANVLRTMVANHIVHHRGQLTVYMRLNDIPVPGVYGPSADEQN